VVSRWEMGARGGGELALAGALLWLVKPHLTAHTGRMNRWAHLSLSSALLFSSASACVPSETVLYPGMVHSGECGVPLPTTCGPRTRVYVSLPSQLGPATPRPSADAPTVGDGGSIRRDLLPQEPHRRRKEVIDLDEEAEFERRVPPDVPGPPTPGEMTEQAAQAKRLFDKAQWPEALDALEAVANGASGDDESNRQIAEYHLAVVNFNLKDYEAATDLFLLISALPAHNKFNESTLWIPLLLDHCVTARAMKVFARFPYTPDVGSCDPRHVRPEMRPRWEFLRAYGLVELGEVGEAAKFFKGLRGHLYYGFRARQCLDWIDKQDPGLETP
jgi:hypothetical protein